MKKQSNKIIQYHEIEEIEKNDDWNILKGETVLEQKVIIPKNNNPILRLFPSLKRRKKESIALVLGGGGAKGLAHVGVIRELEKYDINIDFIAGTSMGAIIGALYALEGNLGLVDQFLRIKTKDLVSLSDFTFSFQGFIKGKKIENILQGLFGNATFDDTNIPLVLNGVDIETGKEVIFKKGKILDAVRASMAIPIVFEPRKIKGHIYVDGGLVNNVPYSHVPKKYKKVVVSNLTWCVPKAKKMNNGLNYLRHIVALLQHNATHVPDEKRIIHIKPDMEGLHIWDFDKLPTMIKRGEIAAKHILPRHLKKSHSRSV